MSYLISEKSNIKNIKSIKTDASTQEITNIQTSSDYDDVSGSSISYEPHSDASKVIYEYTFCCREKTVSEAAFGIRWRLFEDSGSGFASKGVGYNGDAFAYGSNAEEIIKVRYILDAWSGERSFKLGMQLTPGLSQETALHTNFGGDKYNPTVTMFSVT